MADPRAVCVVGLGKLGAPMAACLAQAGFQVIGVDVRAEVVEALNAGRAPVQEPGLEELIRANCSRLSAMTNCQQAIAATSVAFVVVPTPSHASGDFSLEHVMAACASVGEGLRDAGNHLVVLTSTVTPGSTEGAVRLLLEARSGRRCGEDFGLCYSPEFIALGSVIRDFLHPDFILIGESDRRAGDRLEHLYRLVCGDGPPVARMTAVNAELTKLAVNAFVTTKITFANQLARICERLPGADVDTVTAALGLDSRIGRKYLRGAVGYGGPCFPRDSRALAALARSLGVRAGLAEATHQSNLEEVHRLAALVRSKRPPGGVIGILGLAYKPDTDVVEESQGLLLAQLLAQEGMDVVAFDPAAGEQARRRLPASVRVLESWQACIRAADLAVIVTPWPEFRDITSTHVDGAVRPSVIIDCWRVLDRERIALTCDYVTLGTGAVVRSPVLAASRAHGTSE